MARGATACGLKHLAGGAAAPPPPSRPCKATRPWAAAARSCERRGEILEVTLRESQFQGEAWTVVNTGIVFCVDAIVKLKMIIIVIGIKS